MNIYVGNLAFNTSEQELMQEFSQFGEVVNVKIIKDKFTGKSRGFAFVEMGDENAAQNAISSLDGKSVGGRNLKVKEAKPIEHGEEGSDRRGPRRGGNNRFSGGGNSPRGGGFGSGPRGNGGSGRFNREGGSFRGERNGNSRSSY